MTTYNFLQASWKSGRAIVSDLPRNLLEAIEQQLARRARPGGTDLYSFEFTQAVLPFAGLVLSVYEPADSDNLGEPYVHAVVTDAGDGRKLPETALLQLFESIYGAPLEACVRTTMHAFAGWSLPHDERQAHRYFLSEEALLNFLIDGQLNSDPHAAVPLSSLLTRRIGRPAAETSPPNPFLPPRKQPSTPKPNPQASATNETAFEEPPLLLPDQPLPNFAGRHSSEPSSHEISWRIFRASALFTAGALFGILFGARFIPLDFKAPPSHLSGARTSGAVESRGARERLAEHAEILARYQEQFGAQERAFEINPAGERAPADPPAAAAQALPLSPTQPLAGFNVRIRNSAYLRAVPRVEGNEPLRILQDGEVYAVSRAVSLEDGTWYELHHGWIKATPRVRRISETTSEAPGRKEATGKEPLLSPESAVR